MRIYSWNMYFQNRELDSAVDFISKSDFGIFCLQEVPDEMLERLKTLPCHLAYETHWDIVHRSGRTRVHGVILSRYPFVHQGTFPIPSWDKGFPLRARLFRRLMELLGFWKETLYRENRNGLFVDINFGRHGLVRVFCIHLSLTNPLWRAEELELALVADDPTTSTIICGDFNTIESPFSGPLNWIMGGRMSDWLFWRRERATLKGRLAAAGLTNPLAGKRTHPISRSQLDHILLSHHFSAISARVLPERYGSDHYPICVETEN